MLHLHLMSHVHPLRLLLVTLLAINVAACTTPQIPLPPPNIDEFTMEVRVTEGQIRLKGKVVLVGGKIMITDSIGNGIIRVIMGDSTFDTGFFAAQDGARLDISITDTQNSSDPICVVVSYSKQKITHCTN